ncbi:MAG: 50S ribosomal protein L19 [Patescibacteria group bacterium]
MSDQENKKNVTEIGAVVEKPQGADGVIPSDQSETKGAEGSQSENKAEDAVSAALEETKNAQATVVALPHRDIKPGMSVRVHEVIKDLNAKGEERERVQVFEGVVLGVSGAGIQRTMTVRKVSGGIGVEKIYPLSSPHVQKIEVVKQYRTRRSKLWFLRRGFKRRLQEVI